MCIEFDRYLLIDFTIGLALRIIMELYVWSLTGGCILCEYYNSFICNMTNIFYVVLFPFMIAIRRTYVKETRREKLD